MTGYIYKITNTKNNKIYIGQTTKTIEHRFKRHIKNALLNDSRLKNIRLYSAIRKYGPSNFKVEGIDTAFSRDELNKKEIFWIKKLNAKDRNVGYNILDGGYIINENITHGRPKGFKHSDETKKRMSLAKIGVPLSEEHKKHLSEHHHLKTTHILIFKDNHFELSTESVKKLALKLNTSAIKLRRASEVGSFRCGDFYLLDLEKLDISFRHRYRYTKEKIIYDEIKKDIVSPSTIKLRYTYHKDLYKNVNFWHFIPKLQKEKEKYIRQRKQIIKKATNEIKSNN